MPCVGGGLPVPSSDAAQVILNAGLLDQPYYERQRSDRFDRAFDAAVDFIDRGAALGLSPHPLFDLPFYLRAKPQLDVAGGNALVHYIVSGWREGRDPHPLFDAAWFDARTGANGLNNQLSRYLHQADEQLDPNPLFDHSWYHKQYPDAAQSGLSPFAHYVLYGCRERRMPGPALAAAAGHARRPAPEPLRRGSWRRTETTWMIGCGTEEGADADLFERTWRALVDGAYDVRVVVDRRGALHDRMRAQAAPFCLEDACADTVGARPSALRLALFALLEGARDITVATCRVPAVAQALDDLGVVISAPPDTAKRQSPRRRIIVPCMDWSTSGVHTVAQALGEAMIARGWDFRLLFTRGTLGVFDGSTDRRRLPLVPHEFLDVSQCHTLPQHLQAIVGRFESAGPCVVLSTFDDLANAVTPALTDRVGVVGWLQSDEDHYYESASRLGRYWNRLACVSSHIARTVAALDPGLASRIETIPNATVSRSEIVEHRRHLASGPLRLAYVGRLVQQQKRVLDFIPLVHALDRAQVPYRLTLIGDGAGDRSEQSLTRELAAPIARGAVRLTGRIGRADVLRELADQDVLLLLSDFEGFPVAVVEAMARGCVPVVARMKSGIPELIEHDRNGLVIAHRDYDRWAIALGELARDERRMQRLSSAAIRDVIERHTIDVLADRFETLFSSVLEEIVSGRYRRPAAAGGPSPIGDVLLPASLQSLRLDRAATHSS